MFTFTAVIYVIIINLSIGVKAGDCVDIMDSDCVDTMAVTNDYVDTLSVTM